MDPANGTEGEEMKHCTLKFLSGLLLLYPIAALTQTWPTPGRELKVVVGFPAGGGGADVSARFFASKLAEVSGHPVTCRKNSWRQTSQASACLRCERKRGPLSKLRTCSSHQHLLCPMHY
jgi:hypothetical protein